MRLDLEKELNDLAPSPRSRFDFHKVWDRGQRLRRIRLAYFGVGAVVVIAAATAAFALPFDLRRSGDVRPAASPSETPRGGDRDTRLKELANRLKLQLDEVRAQLSQVRATRAETVASLRAARAAGSAGMVRELETRVEALDARVAELRALVDSLKARLRSVQGETETSDAGSTADAYPLLYSRDGLDVYAPAEGQPWGWCPQGARPLAEQDLATANRVVRIAARVLVKQGRWEPDFRTADVIDARIGPEGVFIPQRKACGLETARRTAVIGITFPDVAEWSASIGHATFYVSREDRGWVIWDWPN